MSEAATAKTHKFEAEVSQVLSLVINSLYSNKEVFLRELVSNAADALDKLRFENVQNPGLVPADYQAKIRLIPDEKAKTLTIWDNGIGMTEAALTKDLGTVARSGSKELVERLQKADQKHDLKLIGQFGVGFYSGFLVADTIDVISRAAGSDIAHKWSSAGKDTFLLEPGQREEVGTSVVLHLKSEFEDFTREWKLRELVERYSNFISYPVELQVTRSKKDEPDEVKFEAANKANALWMRSEKEVTDDEYNEFYKHLTHDFEAPLSRSHFHVEGTQMFTGLLYLPKRPPFDMQNPELKHGVRLYVRRVFIMDNCAELLPPWLRMVRGVIDSDDLPLNVSRELLQDSSIVRTIKKQVTRRCLDMLGKLASEREAEYLDFWLKFGPVLKEGLHFDASQSDKIAPLLRYESSADQGLTSLAAYVKRMPEGQTQIYYAQGPSKALLMASPLLEGLKKKGYEVLFMTHGIDQWAIEGLKEFEGKKLVDATQESDDDDSDDDAAEGADKEKAEAASKAKDETSKAFEGLLGRCKDVLAGQLSDVRVSERLTDSPACLVTPRGGLPAHIERLLRSHQQDLPEQKRIMELNPKHPLIVRMNAEFESQPESAHLREWIELLFDQSLLIEGSPLPDPSRFSKRLVALMQTANTTPAA